MDRVATAFRHYTSSTMFVAAEHGHYRLLLRPQMAWLQPPVPVVCCTFRGAGTASNWLIALATVPRWRSPLRDNHPRCQGIFPHADRPDHRLRRLQRRLRERSSSHALTALGIVLMPVYHLVWWPTVLRPLRCAITH